MTSATLHCDQALDALHDALDAAGAGAPSEATLPGPVREHLRACPDCREAWRELSAIEAALFDAPPEPRAEPSPSLRPRILAALDAEPAFSFEAPEPALAGGSSPSRDKPLAFMAAAGLLAAVCAATFFLSPPEAPPAPVSDPPETLIANPSRAEALPEPAPEPAPGFEELEGDPLGDWPLIALEALRREAPRLASVSLPSPPSVTLKAPALALPKVGLSLGPERLDLAVRAKGGELAGLALEALGMDHGTLGRLKSVPALLSEPLPLPSFDLEAPASRLALAARNEAAAFADSIISEAARSLAPRNPFAN